MQVCLPQGKTSDPPAYTRHTAKAYFLGLAKTSPCCGGAPTRVWCFAQRPFVCMPAYGSESNVAYEKVAYTYAWTKTLNASLSTAPTNLE